MALRRIDSTDTEESLIAVFAAFENGRDWYSRYAGRFQFQLALMRLLERRRLVFKHSFCDRQHYEDSRYAFHGQGIGPIDTSQTKMSGTNSANLRMVVDALDQCYSKGHINTVVLNSGDSDFSPLVSKVKENNKRSIGCRVTSATSNLLIADCDEFTYG